MSVEVMWHRPVLCVGGRFGGDCLLRSFHQCSPFLRDNVKNILEANALTNNQLFQVTPSNENNKKKRRRVACTFTLPARSDVSISAQKQEKKNKKCIAKLTEIALNRFSIFTVYNICNVIYIYSQLLFIHFCASSIAFTHNTD